jgi:hypothetical protein
MNIEYIISALSLAISASQLVPLFAHTERLKLRIASVLTIVFAISIATITWSSSRAHRQAIRTAKTQILESLDKPKPFDQIFHDTFYLDYGAVDEAIDELVNEKQLNFQWVPVKAQRGEQVEIRFYARRPVELRDKNGRQY